MPRLSAATVAADVREFFSLREAARRAEGFSVEVRSKIDRDADVARQKREAAEALWLGSSIAEALVLARDALDLALGVADAASIELERRSELDELRKRANERALPVPERDVTADDVDLLRKLLAAHVEVDHRIAPVAMSQAERTRVRAGRASIAAALLVLAISALVYVVRTPKLPRVEASGQWSARFGPSNVLDGNEKTEWLLPDGTAGFIEFEFPKPRVVRAVKVLNGTNNRDPERAVNDYEVQLYAGDRLVKVLPGSFGPFNATPAWRAIETGVTEKLTKVRFQVKTWSGFGGSLAEVAFD